MPRNFELAKFKQAMGQNQASTQSPYPGFARIFISPAPPASPRINDLWIQTGS